MVPPVDLDCAEALAPQGLADRAAFVAAQRPLGRAATDCASALLLHNV